MLCVERHGISTSLASLVSSSKSATQVITTVRVCPRSGMLSQHQPTDQLSSAAPQAAVKATSCAATAAMPLPVQARLKNYAR